MKGNYKTLQIPVEIILDSAELEEIEGCRKRLVDRLGVDMTTERFIAHMLETGSKPHLKRQMDFYVDGKIDGKNIKDL